MASQVKVGNSVPPDPRLTSSRSIRCYSSGPETLESLQSSRYVYLSLGTFIPTAKLTAFIQQMRLIHKVPFSTQEIENYRQLVFNNLTFGLRYVLEAMEDMELEVADDNFKYLEMMAEVTDLPDGEPFPVQYLEPLKALWSDVNVQKAFSRGNEAALPEK